MAKRGASRYSRYSDSYREFYPRSKPRAAKGGIKAQSSRGKFGASWWAQRWIGVLESFDIGARLTRGRSYARQGQVLSIDVNKGQVKAKVQGSRSTPYQVSIQIKPLAPADWKKLAQTLAGQVLFTAKLLAGEMPPDIEQAFQESGLSLFPQKLGDLKTDCSCPDWSNPCKHIAAVYYLLGEEFDRDPFLIFKLRGITREELFELLTTAEQPAGKVPITRKGKQAESREAEPAGAEQEKVPPVQPLLADPALFWGNLELPADLIGAVREPHAPAALPKRLGSFPFWRGEQPFLATLETLYAAASATGLEVLMDYAQRKSSKES